VSSNHDAAVQEFAQADQAYKELEDFFTSGRFINDMYSTSRGDPSVMQREFVTLLERLKTALEERNTKLATVKQTLRDLVAFPPNQWRGEGGRADVKNVGPFSVSSVTHRAFDAETLLRGVRKHGLEETLRSLTGYDTKSGREYHLVEQKWEVDYDGVKNWLKQNNLSDVLETAYEEREGTPRVSGPKPLAFLGEKAKDKE
jgi:hypothetical protein